MSETRTPLLARTLFVAPSAERLRAILSTWWVRALIVSALLVVLQFATFIGNFTGQIAPQWDFYNQYNTEAWAWWRDGSFFEPTQWMPYAWGGFPSLLDVQNSSFYLPVGMMTLFGPFTIHASAILSALHVGFGALGLFLLARSWGVGFVPSLVGLATWFYAAGFYSNASHLDIMRAYAWIPWIVFVIGTTWRWNRWWRWPVAGVILWQGILGMYPGILVACAYVGVVYVIVSQVLFRPKVRSYLLPLVVAGGASLALVMLRYLPLILTRGTNSPSDFDLSEFSQAMWGTFLYPYAPAEGLPNDVTMRSFFLAAGVFALLPFARWGSRKVLAALALVVPAALLGLPFWPWHDAARTLPGMSLSRFTMSDYKPLLLLGIALIAVFGAQRLIESARDKRTVGSRIPVIVSIGILTLFLVLGLLGPFDDLGWIAQFTFLAGAVALAIAVVRQRMRATAAVVAIVAICASSGLVAQLSTAAPWVSDRPAFERLYLGLPVDTLIAQGDEYEAANRDLTQRPARSTPVEPFDEAQAFSTLWGASFYTRQDAVLGYVNIKGAAPFEIMSAELFPSGTPIARKALAFWSAPGVVMQRHGNDLPTAKELERCVDDSDCGATVTPVSYSPGDLVYRVSADETFAFHANEAYYAGWHVTACSVDEPDDCRAVKIRQGVHGELVGRVAAGEWNLTLRYSLPGMPTAWKLFWAGVVVLLVGGVVAEVSHLVGRRRQASR